jgi:uncharacterized membrane protein
VAAFNRIGYKEKAKRDLKGNWGMAAIMTLIMVLISSITVPIPIVNIILALFIVPALVLGFTMAFLRLARGQQFDLNTLFDGFKYIMKAFGLHFLTGLFIFLWSLLFIIPGIVAALRYSMAFHILADNPDIGVMEAIEKSKMMTQGYKLDIFIMYLSFMGWAILSAFTLGIGVLWLAPYISTSFANVYLALKGEETLSASA